MLISPRALVQPPPSLRRGDVGRDLPGRRCADPPGSRFYGVAATFDQELDTSAAQIAAIRADYPGMFPGGIPIPIFTYTLDPPLGAAGCRAAVSSPCNIRDIGVTLIVQSPQRDAEIRRLRLVELNGRGHRLNPNQ